MWQEVYAQIWVIHYAFRDKCSHPFIVPTRSYVIPIESPVLDQSGENKHVGGAGPANLNHAFKHWAIFLLERKMVDVRVEELIQVYFRLFSYIYVSTEQLTLFTNTAIILSN